MLPVTSQFALSRPRIYHPILLLLVIETVILLASVLFSPIYTCVALFGICWIIICFLWPNIGTLVIALTISSPFFLYLDRVRSTELTVALIGAAFLLSLLGGQDAHPHASTKIEAAASLFVAYMVLNCVWSIWRGNNLDYAFNELIPVAEMYVAYRLAVRTRFSHKSVRQFVCLIFVFVAARGAWQIFLFLIGKAGTVVPPVFGDNADWANINISGFEFTRLFDPIQGLYLAPAFSFVLVLLSGRLRRVSALMLLVGSLVLALGLERGEWIASIICVFVVICLVRKRAADVFRRVTIGLAAIAAVGALMSMFLRNLPMSLGTILLDRLVGYTEQQVLDPRNSLQAVRFLEYVTTKNALASSALFGHGLGSGLGTVVSDGISLQFIPIHNYFLNLLANAGLVGAGLLLYLTVRLAKTLFERLKHARYTFDLGLVLSSIVAVLWYAVFSAFHPVYSSYHLPALLGIYVGITISYTGRAGYGISIPARQG